MIKKNKFILFLIFLLITLFFIVSFLIIYNGGSLVHSLTGNIIKIHGNIVGIVETEIMINNPSLEQKLVIPVSFYYIMKKQLVRKKEVDRLFNSFKKEDLLEDRAEYDKEDLQSAYPQLNEKEIKLLYLKIQQWKYAQIKKNKKSGLKSINISCKPHR